MTRKLLERWGCVPPNELQFSDRLVMEFAARLCGDTVRGKASERSIGNLIPSGKSAPSIDSAIQQDDWRTTGQPESAGINRHL